MFLTGSTFSVTFYPGKQGTIGSVFALLFWKYRRLGTRPEITLVLNRFLCNINVLIHVLHYWTLFIMKTVKLCRLVIPHAWVVRICLVATFLGACKEDLDELIKEEGDVIYVNAVILEDVYYHQVSYDKPTILIFRNLKRATNSVYFHQCVNIKEVHFPNLVSIGDMNAGNPYLYLHQNEGLEKLKAPELTTVYGYLYFSGNSSLDLSTGICGIADVYPRGNPDETDCSNPSVYMVGNATNDICAPVVLHFCN